MKRTNKGFTLIELMIVVAIIGILAAIAIPNFLRFQLKSKTSEGKVNLAAIRTAQESYQAEFGTYVESGGTFPPGHTQDTQKFAWDPTTTGGFGTIGWAPEGPVYFEYAVSTPNSLPTASNRFTASARADIDDDGTAQVWGYARTQDDLIREADVNLGCVVAELAAPNQVGPCDSVQAGGNGQFGNAVF